MIRRHPGALFWSQWSANDLSWTGRLRGAWHVRVCPACRATAARLRHEQAAYTQSTAFAEGLARLQRRTPAPAPVRRAWPIMALAGGLATAMLALVQTPSPSLRAKGAESRFALYVQRGEAASPQGDTCRTGDALRARYESTRAYLMVVEIDGHDRAQVVFPADGTVSAPITAGHHLTPGSWVLDDSPGRERFIALFSDTPLKFAEVRGCLSGAASCGADTVRLEVACRKM